MCSLTGPEHHIIFYGSLIIGPQGEQRRYFKFDTDE